MIMKQNIKAEDWIKGKSAEGELIIGFVEKINEENQTMTVKVIQAEQNFEIGTTVELPANSVVKLSNSSFRSQEEVLSVIDLALETNDEEWFQDLIGQFYSLKYAKSHRSKKEKFHSSQRNRLDSPYLR